MELCPHCQTYYDDDNDTQPCCACGHPILCCCGELETGVSDDFVDIQEF